MELPNSDPLKPQDVAIVRKIETRFVNIPNDRLIPLRKAWMSHFHDPIRNEMKIKIRVNTKVRPLRVELKTMATTPPDSSNLQKCHDYLTAFMAGFDADQVKDAFLKSDNNEFYQESLEIQNAKKVNVSRAVGGKTKLIIENATKTMIVVANKTIRLCGSYAAIEFAKYCISRLIMSTPVNSRRRILPSSL